MSEYEELAQKADEARQKVKDLQAESQGMFVDGSLPAGQFEAYQEIADKIKQAKEEESQLVAQA
jgi:hypothetical protein